MMKLRSTSGLAAAIVAAAAFLGLSDTARAAGELPPYPSIDYSFEGPFGTFDRAQLQRGFQVYREVCANCHGLTRVSFRTLTDIGYTEDEVKAIAAEYTFPGDINDEGERPERPGIPADYFPDLYANKQEAVFLHGAYPVDLSLITKARPSATDYLPALLQGYGEEPPEFIDPGAGHWNVFYGGKVKVPEGFAEPEEPIFGGVIGMVQPLWGDDVEYADGTEATIKQQAEDVTAFLMWAAEPSMEERKQLGIKAMIFLLVFTILFYAIKRKIWADVH